MSEFSEINRYQRALTLAEQRPAMGLRNSGNALLTFESALEPDYLEHRRLETLPVTRIGLLLAAGLYIAFFAVDFLFFKRYQHWWTVVPLLLIATSSNLLLWWATFQARFTRHIAFMEVGVVLINAFAFAFASAYGHRMGEPIPPEAAVIQQLYTLFLLSLPFRFCAPISLVIFGVFCFLHAVTGMRGDDLFIRCFMMGASGLLGTFACYLTERTQRLAWLRARLLQELSEHDSLTGLYNHRIFYQRGEQLLKQARRDRCGVAVLVGDVDHFKKFNDTHGHLAGDDALRHVSTALARSARRPLDIAARLGGEEFGLLLYNVTLETAQQRADELRNTIRALMLSEGRRVTISIGIAVMEPADKSTIEALIGIADSALYRAKEAGRDRVAS